MTAMATTREPTNDFAALAAQLAAGASIMSIGAPGSLDITQWLYDTPTGLLTNKLYADNLGPSYTYTPDGKLETRNWARGVTTTYSYTNTTGELIGITYSDSTPAVSFAYDRLGRQKVAQTFLSAHHFSYDPATLTLTTETIIANGQTNTITRDQDVFGRASAVTLGPDYAITYAYDNVGRFSGLSSSIGSTGSTMSNHWQYTYLPNSDLISGWSNGILETVRTYEPTRDLITAVENRAGPDLISRFDYENDPLARRTARIDHSGAGVSPAITNAFGYNIRSEVVAALMGGNDYGYAYDPIGNRQTATHNAEALTYLANDLNQYTTITNGGIRTLAYDLDGNLTNDSVFAYTWDGENRLISAEQVGTAVPAVRFAYDYMSRRVEKAVNGVTNRFVYDGWNLVSETTSTGVTNDYVWGLDLSGTLQGAGGIGGLLAVVHNGQPCHPVADANGNITDYVDTNGTVVAHYEFDAFGNTIVATGNMAHTLHYWFSTKYLDEETGFYYYGYRYYDPVTGRWMSRDPLESNQRSNLYEALLNSPIGQIDPEGLVTFFQRNINEVFAPPVFAARNSEWECGTLSLRYAAIDASLNMSLLDEDPIGYNEIISSAPGRVPILYQRRITNPSYLGAGFVMSFTPRADCCCERIRWEQWVMNDSVDGVGPLPPRLDYNYLGGITSDFPGNNFSGRRNRLVIMVFTLKVFCVKQDGAETQVAEANWSIDINAKSPDAGDKPVVNLFISF
jgi:RHS repeat-associated protein